MSPAGERTLSRMTFTVLAPGRVRQLIERSRDGGQSYIRKQP